MLGGQSLTSDELFFRKRKKKNRRLNIVTSILEIKSTENQDMGIPPTSKSASELETSAAKDNEQRSASSRGLTIHIYLSCLHCQ